MIVRYKYMYFEICFLFVSLSGTESLGLRRETVFCCLVFEMSWVAGLKR